MQPSSSLSIADSTQTWYVLHDPLLRAALGLDALDANDLPKIVAKTPWPLDSVWSSKVIRRYRQIVSGRDPSSILLHLSLPQILTSRCLVCRFMADWAPAGRDYRTRCRCTGHRHPIISDAPRSQPLLGSNDRRQCHRGN